MASSDAIPLPSSLNVAQQDITQAERETSPTSHAHNMASSDAIPLPSSLNVAQDITQAERETSPTSHAHPVAISQAAIFLTLVASLL